MYQFFSHPSRPMVNPVLTIMLEYLQAEWLLNSKMESEIRLASRTVRRQEKLAIKAAAEEPQAQAPVAVTFMSSLRGVLGYGSKRKRNAEEPQAPVPVTFRHSAAAEEPKEEGPSTKKHKSNR